MFDLSKNYEISRKIATGGIVLLKNEDNVLPLSPEVCVGFVGKECLEIEKGGGGSSLVKCEYEKTLLDGIKEKGNKINFFDASVSFAEKSAYDVNTLNHLADKVDVCIVTFKRYGREGKDRKVGEKLLSNDEKKSISEEELKYSINPGFYYPSARELELFDNIQKSKLKQVVLILNISDIVDLSFIQHYSKIKAVLLVYFPGMEYGRAIADILCGDENPSGKLVDTIAYDYRDYPTSNYYNTDKYKSKYKEGIFVGYRYFETYAKDKVMYPFGFGISYTQFDITNCSLKYDDAKISVIADVTNTGHMAGREVVQVYISAPNKLMEKPAVELKAFAKTKKLNPGECQTVELSFNIDTMASFDHIGVTGYKGAWVMESGDYEIYIGNSVRNLTLSGKYNVPEHRVTEQLTIRFDGREYVRSSCDFNDEYYEKTENLSLYDVSDGKITLHDFVNQLSAEELISLSLGQPLSFVNGTSGLGNLRKYQVPNPQTADGPLGIRRSINSTCFPCATLMACTWDSEIQYDMGKALGFEGYTTGIDIVLGPAMNIHRDPRCGRNFEYYSEDPLVSGKTAAAVVRGTQSEGLLATLKHFAANNCEDNRCVSSSIVDERTLREIYLKGFEIAVKESNPAYIMTAYSLLNDIHVSANAQLLRGVLRDEWHYEGATMTDWRTGVPLVDELIGGNNIKMPFGYPDEGEKAYEAYKKGILSLSILRENAFYVLKSVMKTRSFDKKDFGVIHKLVGDQLDIPVMMVNGLASARIMHDVREDGTEYLWRLNREQRNQRSFVCYVLDSEVEGDFKMTMEISTNCPETQIWIYDENNIKTATACCNVAVDENKWYKVDARVPIHKGENIIKLVFANEPYTDYEYYFAGAEIPNQWPELSSDDIKLAKLSLTSVQRRK